jgi:hypothetical protein
MATLLGMPDDILHEIAYYLQRSVASTLTQSPIRTEEIRRMCCGTRQPSSDNPCRRQEFTSDLLAFASVNHCIRSVIFSAWLLDRITIGLCGCQWEGIGNLSEELKNQVR